VNFSHPAASKGNNRIILSSKGKKKGDEVLPKIIGKSVEEGGGTTSLKSFVQSVERKKEDKKGANLDPRERGGRTLFSYQSEKEGGGRKG